MNPNLLDGKRLQFREEQEVRDLLRNGSDKITQLLTEHFLDHGPANHEPILRSALKIVGETLFKVSTVAAFQADTDNPVTGLSFLPGYLMKNWKRLTFLVTDGDKEITSDISFWIDSNGEINRNEGVGNHSLLYYSSLQDHKDLDGFTPGGTHQWLTANEREILAPSGYHLDYLHVTSDLDAVSDKTARCIRIDFSQMNTCSKLFEFLFGQLNETTTKLQYQWPFNFEDPGTTQEELNTLRKMRGHLVALWFKILCDKNQHNNISWIEECMELAEKYGYIALKGRLFILKDRLILSVEKLFNHWYSIRFSSMPDFTGQGWSEPFGSAMILTNGRLDSNYFYYVKPWINRMYHHFRLFETTEELRERGSPREYYYPSISANEVHKDGHHGILPRNINDYIDACVSDRYSDIGLFRERCDEAIEALELLSKARAYFANSDMKNFNIILESFLSKEIVRQYGSAIGPISNQDSIDDFSYKIVFGRVLSIGAVTCLNFTGQDIHAFLVGAGILDFNDLGTNVSRSPLNYLTKYLFIYGFLRNKKNEKSKHELRQIRRNVWDGSSPSEKYILESFFKNYIHWVNESFTEAGKGQVKRAIGWDNLPNVLKAL